MKVYPRQGQNWDSQWTAVINFCRERIVTTAGVGYAIKPHLSLGYGLAVIVQVFRHTHQYVP